VGAFTFATSLLAWLGIKAVMGVRVSGAHEIAGLDVSEMGSEAYADGVDAARGVGAEPVEADASAAPGAG
jgi:ammonia channel protein AmtB